MAGRTVSSSGKAKAGQSGETVESKSVASKKLSKARKKEKPAKAAKPAKPVKPAKKERKPARTARSATSTITATKTSQDSLQTQSDSGAFVDARAMSDKDYVSQTLQSTAGSLGVVSRPKVVDFTERAKERKRASIWMILLRVLIGIVAACALGALIWLLFFSSVFRLNADAVSVSGTTDWVTEQQVRDIANKQTDKSLLLASSSKITSEVNDIAGVKSVKVTKHFPKSLSVEVTAEKPAAILKSNGLPLEPVDSQGRSMGTVDGKDTSGIPVVEVTNVASAARTQAIKEALNVLASMSDDMRQTVTSMTAKTQDSITTVLNTGFTIVWGDSSNMDLKKADVQELTKKITNGEDNLTWKRTIDVSSPKSPIVK